MPIPVFERGFPGSLFGEFFAPPGAPAIAASPITFKQSNTAEIQPGTSPFNVTLPNSYSTHAGDCIIVCATLAGAGGTIAISGCGATWVVTQFLSSPNYVIGVGYNCTANGTTIQISNNANTNGDIIVSIFSGVLASSNPIVAGTPQTNTANPVLTITSPSVSYTTGQLVLGFAGFAGGGTAGQFGSNPATWSSGATNINAAISQNATNTSRPTSCDYFIASNSNSTTLTETLNNGGSSNGMGIAVIVLKHS